MSAVLAKGRRLRRRWLVPEVIQTSNMDCGPACLASVLEGFRLPVSVGRLREVCQTDVDGTSIDTIEWVARELGLDARQVLVPIEQLAESPDRMLPAVVIVRLSNGANHFLVVWRRIGNWLQVMDPGNGRRWVRVQRFLENVYEHGVRADAGAWRDWAGSSAFCDPLRKRLKQLGLDGKGVDACLERALLDSSWQGLANLDAAERTTRSIVRAGGARRGTEAGRMLQVLLDDPGAGPCLPHGSWAVRPDTTDGQVLHMRGAVLVRFSGESPPRNASEGEGATSEPLSPILKEALGGPRQRPLGALLELVREGGWTAPVSLMLASVVAAIVVLAQALTFRALVDVQGHLVLPEQRIAAMGFVFALLACGVLLELPLLSGILRAGRHLETRLRVAFQSKLPRLSDRYFQSRPISDMTERAHSIHRVRGLPMIIGQLVRLGCQLTFTTGALIWIAPHSAGLAFALVLISVALPLLTQSWIVERELRTRSLHGALAKFHLDALLGLVPIHTHGAQRGLRREHEHMLARWFRSNLGLRRVLVGLDALQMTLTTGLAAWLVIDHLVRAPHASSTLLLCYWALTLPNLGREFGSLWLSLPAMRNATLRLLEPLGAVEMEPRPGEGARVDPKSSGERQGEPQGATRVVLPLPGEALGTGLRAAGTSVGATREVASSWARGDTPSSGRKPAGVALRFEGVRVRAAGHTLLEDLNLSIHAGEHIAILGRSGAGKSTLLGLLLGWHEPAVGSLLVDGQPLHGDALSQLRRESAWVDPAVQLWNRSLLDNVAYGQSELSGQALGCALDQADLIEVLEGLPMGLDEPLGEGGGLLSGGEGQRVRLGRAFARRGARLILLDEPFRGLDRGRRRELMQRTREQFKHSTLLCVTHDVEETRRFDRVLVIEDGRLVEDGAPQTLLARKDSPYRRLHEAELRVQRDVWGSDHWQRWRLSASGLEVRKGGEQ